MPHVNSNYFCGYAGGNAITLARLRTAEPDPGSHPFVKRHTGNGEVSGNSTNPYFESPDVIPRRAPDPTC